MNFFFRIPILQNILKISSYHLFLLLLQFRTYDIAIICLIYLYCRLLRIKKIKTYFFFRTAKIHFFSIINNIFLIYFNLWTISKNALQARCWILSEKESIEINNVANRCFRTTICQCLFNTIVFRLFYIHNLCFLMFYVCKDTTFFRIFWQSNHSPA